MFMFMLLLCYAMVMASLVIIFLKVDSQNFTASATLEGLGQGEHHFWVMDSYGCSGEIIVFMQTDPGNTH